MAKIKNLKNEKTCCTVYIFDIIFKIFGLSRLNSDKEQKTAKNMFLFAYSIILAFVLAISMIILQTIPKSILFVFPVDTFDDLIVIVYFFLNFLIVIVTFICNIVHEKSYWKILSDLENLELDYERPWSRKKYAYCKTALISALIFIGYIIHIYYTVDEWATPENIKQCIATFVICCPGFYTAMSTCKTSMLLCHIETKYVILNDGYKDFDVTTYLYNDYKNIIACNMTMEEIRLSLFRKYKNIHMALGKMVKEVENKFSLALFVDITRAFFMIYFGTYWLISERYFQKAHGKAALKHLTSIILHVIKLIMLTSTCTGIEDEYNLSKVRVDQIMQGCSSKVMQEEATPLAAQLRERMSVSACGMFLINYSLLLQMLGGFLTNFVLILQLRFPELLKI